VVKDFQPSLAPGPLNGIRGVGNVLEFPKDKLGDEQGPFDETGFGDVRNTAIDDHTGIQDFHILIFGEVFRGRFPAGKIKFLSLFETDPEANIATNPIKETIDRKGYSVIVY
jgi:hypothetical protein